MSLSEHRAKSEEQRNRILEEKMRRAKSVANNVLESDTFKAQLAAVPESPEIFDKVITHVVQEVFDPVNDYIDTLSARGYSDPVIRRITRNLAMAFKLTEDDVLYEEKVKAVAEWAAENPWVYDSLDNYS